MAVHLRYNSEYIPLTSSAKQRVFENRDGDGDGDDSGETTTPSSMYFGERGL